MNYFHTKNQWLAVLSIPGCSWTGGGTINLSKCCYGSTK
jgi:hypothetical protein